jgi:hypothetical protein
MKTCIYPVEFFLEWETFQTKSFRENQNTHFMFIFLFDNRAIREVMWKNMVDPDRSKMMI